MKRAWWKLTITGKIDRVQDLNDDDREHIAKLIIDGYSQGEVIHHEEDDTQDDICENND